MNKQKVLSFLRKALIVVLLLSAVFLYGKTGYTTGLKNKLHPVQDNTFSGETGGGTEIGLELVGMIQPKAVVVCGGETGKYGTAFCDATTTDFLHFSAVFGEALGSAGVPESLSEEEFHKKLNQRGVTLKFYCPFPLSLLSGLLRAEMTSTAAANQTDLLCLCISEDNKETELCYLTVDGNCFQCSTAVPCEGLENRITEYIPNNTEYAFENRNLSGGDEYAVLVNLQASAPTLKQLTSIPQESTDTDRLLQSVGMNSYVATSYSEADGTTVFVDEEATLRISPDGSVIFRRSGAPGVTSDLQASTIASIAWRIAEQNISKTCGDAAVIFSGITRNEGQRTGTIYLDYAVNGIPIQLDNGHAAEIVTRGETVLQARLQMKQFFLNEEEEAILPCLQAFAIAGAENASAQLAYVNIDNVMKCCWVNTNG